jgi:hypothetical protein
MSIVFRFVMFISCVWKLPLTLARVNWKEEMILVAKRRRKPQ